METGNYAEARKCFQTALKIFPWDPLTLSSLAMSLLALGYIVPVNNTWADYDAKLKSIVNSADLISSEDPELLFQASVFPGLDEIVGKRFARLREKTKSNKDDVEEDDDVNKSSKDIKDVPPEVLYWYGMYYLKKGSSSDLAKAKVLFTRAVQRKDCPPHPMSLYMLGWIAEIQDDLTVAEKYYCYALQLEPMDPLNFLRLIQLSNDTLTFVKTLKRRSEQIELKSKKMAKRKRKNKKSSTADILGISYGGDNDVFADEEDVHIHSSKSPSVESMKKRVLLHERVHRLSLLRKQQLKSEKIEGLHTPGKMIYIDPFWLDRLLYSFSQCDDWTFLLRASREFREKKKEQKE
jgi:tetratricopeptide (TPR) repeat protein